MTLAHHYKYIHNYVPIYLSVYLSIYLSDIYLTTWSITNFRTKYSISAPFNTVITRHMAIEHMGNATEELNVKLYLILIN